MLIVNYYPGSLGDTIITHLANVEHWRDYVDSVKIDYPWNLKTMLFYQSSDNQQQMIYKCFIKPWLDNNKVIGAHRFESFDYRFNRMHLGKKDDLGERFKSNFIHYAGPDVYGNGNKFETMMNDYKTLYTQL